MKSNRPVNLSLSTVLLVNLKSPVAIASILHRISGIVIFLLIPVLLYLLQQSLASPEGFQYVQDHVLGSCIGKGLVFITLAGLIYHAVAGVKHLIQDFGVGESLSAGRYMAWAALAIAAVLIALAFVWVVF